MECEYRKCNETINNTVFCARQNIITAQTSSPRSVMVTTFVETKTSPNKPITSNFTYITRYTTDTTDHKIVSASEAELAIGKCLVVLVGYKNIDDERLLLITKNRSNTLTRNHLF